VRSPAIDDGTTRHRWRAGVVSAAEFTANPAGPPLAQDIDMQTQTRNRLPIRTFTVAALVSSSLAACGGEPPQPGEDESTATTEADILNGSRSDGWAPAVVTVIATFSKGTTYCTGTFINPWDVLTAAHCLRPLGESPSRVEVVLGTSSNGTRHKADTVRANPGLVAPPFVANDVGIVSFNQAMRTWDQTFPVTSWTMPAASHVGETVVMVGFGDSNSVPAGAGTQRWDYGHITENAGGMTLVVKGNPSSSGAATGSCDGDDGGPVLELINGRWTIVGIIASGYGQCIPAGETYASMPSHLRSWIDANDSIGEIVQE
jgi:secreted trypsin-like serine protease